MFVWAGRYLPVTSPNFDQVGSAAYYGIRLIEQLIVVSIPAFLFVSGFFVAFATGRTHKTVGWNIIGARVKSLLIPYLLWSFLVFAAGFVLDGRRLPPLAYVQLLLTGGANPAYYYIILLIQFYLLSPFLIPLAKNHWVSLLAVSLVLQLTVQLLQYPVILGLDIPVWLQPFVDRFPKWFFPVRIFWFSLGIVAGFHLKGLKAWVIRYRWHLLILTIATYVLGVIEWEMYIKWSGHTAMTHRETLIDNVYSLAFLFAFIGFSNIDIPASKQLSQWGSKSFGIYISHAPLMGYIARGVYHLAPWLLGVQILFLPLMVVLGLGIPLAVMALMEKSVAKKYYQYVFG